jgi:hypothetical protein
MMQTRRTEITNLGPGAGAVDAVRARVGRPILGYLGAEAAEAIERANAVKDTAGLTLLDDSSRGIAEYGGEDGGDGGEAHDEGSEERWMSSVGSGRRVEFCRSGG